MAPERFDLIVIGTGSGLDVANWAAQAGMRVAIVEKDAPGGTCLNRGCIPSKMLLHSADVAETIRHAGTFGVHARVEHIDFPALMARVREHVDGSSQAIARGLSGSANPRAFFGAARFVGPKRLAVGRLELEAEKFLLATGARPRVPEIPGLREAGFLTSTEALERPRLPESLIILGGGFISAELGHFFGALGTRVTIVHRHDVLLSRHDHEIADRFTNAFARKHRVILGTEATRVERTNEKRVRVHLTNGEVLEAGDILVAVGVTRNSDTLDLEKTGVAVHPDGKIVVDAFLETTRPGIFALGDAVGRYDLKHNANHEAQYAFENLKGGKIAVDYSAMPHAVFSSPQVAAVGETEEQLRARNASYLVGRRAFIDTAMGKALADQDGLVKLLVDKESRHVLGCHIVGTQAATLVHEVVVAMHLGATVDDLGSAIHIHPALNEVVARATWDLEEPGARDGADGAAVHAR